jgi:hypothetical protein
MNNNGMPQTMLNYRRNRRRRLGRPLKRLLYEVETGLSRPNELLGAGGGGGGGGGDDDDDDDDDDDHDDVDD